MKIFTVTPIFLIELLKTNAQADTIRTAKDTGMKASPIFGH
jgi:hypothetical protein